MPVRLIALVAMLIAFVAPPAFAAEAAPPVAASIEPAVAGNGTGNDPLLRWLRDAGAGKPSLREMIGQMILVGFPGTRPQEEWPARIIAMIHEGRIGGVILFAQNVVAPAQVKALNLAIGRAGGELPPFVCIDQEGGAIQRLTRAKGFVGLPGAAKMARMSLDKAYDLDVRSADELAGLGFTVNFGPVVDLNVNPGNPAIGRRGRSYGADPAVVIAYARQFIDAHERAGILTVAKHFPGLGSARSDPHEQVVNVSRTWSEAELLPYRSLIDAGAGDMVMVGHLIGPEFSDGGNTPASLSRSAIAGQLRGRLGFQGLVVTDDLNMAAIQKRYSTEQAAVMALAAGADLLIVANNGRPDPTVADRITGAVLQAVADGRISAEQLRRAYDLIVAAKHRQKGHVFAMD